MNRLQKLISANGGAAALVVGLVLAGLSLPAPAKGCCGTVYDPANHQANQSQLGQAVISAGESVRQSQYQDSVLKAIGPSGNSSLALPGIFTSGSPDLYGGSAGSGFLGNTQLSDTERAEAPRLNYLKILSTSVGIARAMDSSTRGYGQSFGLVGLLPAFSYLTGDLRPGGTEFANVPTARNWSYRVYSDPLLREPSLNRDAALNQARTRQIEARRRQEFSDAALDAHAAAVYHLRNAENGITRVTRFKEAMDVAANQDLRSQITVLTQVMIGVMEEQAMSRSLAASQLRLDAARAFSTIPVRQDMIPISGQVQ